MSIDSSPTDYADRLARLPVRGAMQLGPSRAADRR